VRPSSIEKPAAIALKEKGVKVVAVDLKDNQDELVAVLKGIDVVISAIYYQSLHDEIPLSTAAKAAGVKRYVPCFFATVAPRGIMKARDTVSFHQAIDTSTNHRHTTERGDPRPYSAYLSPLHSN
jgi:hypothetical protein